MQIRFITTALFTIACSPGAADDLSSREVLRAIDFGNRFLAGQQNADGSWSSQYGNVGPTALAVLALLSAGQPADDPVVAQGLRYIRAVRPDGFSRAETYEVSLVIMALAAADGPGDRARIAALAARLEQGQITRGENAGLWTYRLDGRAGLTEGDRSNGQFAVLALREAAFVGAPISRATWTRVRDHWLGAQNPDGGWGYAPRFRPASYGSMTVAGIATLHIVETMLDDGGFQPDGTADCCNDRRDTEIQRALERADRWMASHFAVNHHPGYERSGLLYYLYGLERAGRLSGQRFFGGHDWYREGAAFLVRNQTPRDGGWRGVGHGEADPVLGTSFALLFLSKGLSPVLVNKLKFGPTRPGTTEVLSDAWNLHANEARHLTEFLSRRPDWPRLLAWQVADLPKAAANQAVGDLLQAPVLYITGRDGPPTLSDAEATLLRAYLDQGGFLFIVAACNRNAWDAEVRNLVARLYPNGEAHLERLRSDHPVYRAEFLLDDPEAIELWGVDVGCRTALIYSPDDLGCLWERWRPFEVPDRPSGATAAMTRSLRIGTNVLAYATGREPPSRLDVDPGRPREAETTPVERGLLQIAKLRHRGDWDVSPRALPNLLVALNETAGLAASTRPNVVSATDADLFRYPLLYMHGRSTFEMTAQEVQRLRQHLDRGAVLVADAVCSSPAFDAAFRRLARELYPESELKRIPPHHELFSTAVGADLSQVRRRTAAAAGEPRLEIQVGEPLLEGIEVEGRIAVIYSRHDLGCGLGRQTSTACAGYLPEDAMRIAINVVLYAMLQDVVLHSPHE